MGEWVSVEERMPPEGQRILIYKVHSPGFSKMFSVDIGRWTGWAWVNDRGSALSQLAYSITHWMPLPEPPKIQGDKP